MSSLFGVFDTSYAKANQDTLRFTSIAIAAVIFLCCLIAGVVVYTKKRFRTELESKTGTEVKNVPVQMAGSTVTRLILIAFFWLVTLVATFLSWYVAALHIQKNHLIAFDVLNVIIFIMLALATYFYYKDTPINDASRMLVGSSAVLEFIAIILLMVTNTTSGTDGTLVQSALYVALFISTITKLNR